MAFERLVSSRSSSALRVCLQFPLFLRFATSNNAVFVRHALDSMFNVLGTCEDDVPIIVLTQISPYVDVRTAIVAPFHRITSLITYCVCLCVQILSKLTQHPDSDVRNVVCKSLIALLDKAGEHLLPIIPSLTEYFLTVCACNHVESCSLCQHSCYT